MKQDDLSIIINYCSKDKAFIYINIEECLKITYNIIVSCGNKLFDGENEDLNHLQSLQEKYPLIKVLIFDVNLNEYNPLNYRKNAYFPNKARLLGYKEAKKIYDTNWYLFIDVDEIPDAEIFLKNIQRFDDPNITYKFFTFTYFREPIYLSNFMESLVLLCHKNNITNKSLMHPMERTFYISNNERMDNSIIININHKVVDVLDINSNQPIFHHFSWVRSKENMIKKIRGWSHRDDKDWISIIEEEFTHDFNFTDFVYKEKEKLYNMKIEYKIVDNKFNIKDY